MRYVELLHVLGQQRLLIVRHVLRIVLAQGLVHVIELLNVMPIEIIHIINNIFFKGKH